MTEPRFNVYDDHGRHRALDPVFDLEELDELAQLAAAEHRDAYLRAFERQPDGGERLVAVRSVLFGEVREWDPKDYPFFPFFHSVHFATCASCRAAMAPHVQERLRDPYPRKLDCEQ